MYMVLFMKWSILASECRSESRSRCKRLQKATSVYLYYINSCVHHVTAIAHTQNTRLFAQYALFVVRWDDWYWHWLCRLELNYPERFVIHHDSRTIENWPRSYQLSSGNHWRTGPIRNCDWRTVSIRSMKRESVTDTKDRIILRELWAYKFCMSGLTYRAKSKTSVGCKCGWSDYDAQLHRGSLQVARRSSLGWECATLK